METTPHPDIERPDSVTHYLCVNGPTAAGQPAATHHLVPRNSVLVCRYCHRSEGNLRALLGLAGA